MRRGYLNIFPTYIDGGDNITFRLCPICNCTFEVNTSGRPRKYCSDKCRKQAELQNRKKQRVIIKKCEYCGKTFNGNNKQKYCTTKCYDYAHKEQMLSNKLYHYYHDIEYRKKQMFKYGDANGTLKIQDNEVCDWEKELIIVRALKKKAGINKR